MPADNNNSADEGESLQRLHDTIFSVRNSHDVAGPSSSSREIEQNEPKTERSYDLTAAELSQIVLRSFPNGQSLLSTLFNILRQKEDNNIQEELMDLLGWDHFELVSRILRNQNALCEEVNEKVMRCKKLRKDLPMWMDVIDSTPHQGSDPTLCGSGITIRTLSEEQAGKKKAKYERKKKKQMNKIVASLNDTEKLEVEKARRDLLRRRKEEEDEEKELKLAIKRSLLDTTAKDNNFLRNETKKLPFVFDSMLTAPLADFNLYGIKFVLPEGTKRKNRGSFEEVTVPPPADERPLPENYEPIKIDSLDAVGKACFEGYEKLNTIQSIVFEQAYNTLENLLICAPTGAGKTNIAMLTVLKTIRDHMKFSGEIDKDAFKVIYIAPMKALASEMTRNFSKRLAPIGLKVRELTGDTQLTRKEIAETQMLVLTPEKWDVLTRKADDEGLTQLVRLLIIDEVHLLHDERGPVIESIVARTFRQMEVYHQKVRIVGLSATLPNYVDVAHFLRVDLEKGLFFFDGRFRPVPLTQTFIGVSVNRYSSVKDTNELFSEACYEKCMQFLREDHQVLVFVHSRNGTSRSAQYFLNAAANKGHQELLLPSNITSGAYLAARKQMKAARCEELNQFFDCGMGIHHGGLIRSDRNLMERMFAGGHIRVMFCTATLAWGVNLPAHAVIIQGTEIYDPEKGATRDIGALDVQQIFGRAGRPQFETSGHGVIITAESKLTKYLAMLVRHVPIESNFHTKILDNLNAEIARGTVTNIKEAVEWIRFTYFYIRARKNPMVYGINVQDLKKDADLTEYLTDFCHCAARKLDANRMVRFDSINEYLSTTDLGRIASNFYINFDTIERFNDENAPVKLVPYMTDDAIIGLISLASEFSLITSRDTEMVELEETVSFGCVFPIRGGGLASSEGKVNCLLQSYVSRAYISNFTLMSEALYIAQNGSRIARALFEIVLRRNWAQATFASLQMSKCIQRRVWPFNSPLRQLMDVDLVKETTVSKIEKRQMSVDNLWELDAGELGAMFSCNGPKLYEIIRYIPIVGAEAIIKPITRTIIQIEACLTPSFRWNDRLLGSAGSQRYWVFAEDLEENVILHYEQVAFTKKMVNRRESHKLIFVIPIHGDQLRHQYQLRIAHDSFVVDDTLVPLSLHNCTLPAVMQPHTDLLDLDPLPLKTLKNERYERLYSFEFFNPVQTQVFYALYQTDENVLIGAPTSSGKTLCAELAIFRLFNEKADKKCVYIAPLKALVRERVLDWNRKFCEKLGVKIVEVSGDHTPELSELEAASILITTPEKWDGITRNMETRNYVRRVELMIIDEIHLLGVERGAVLEAIVTRIKTIARRRSLNKMPMRVVGLSTALANAGDIAEWIGVKEPFLYNFRPNVRPIPVDVHIQGFAGQHYCPRMALMNKPAFNAIKQFSPLKPTLLFVASRRQTRLTAMAFVSLLALDEDPRQWLHMDEDELQRVIRQVKDDNLKITLPFGIGIHHAGLHHHERSLVEKLFVEKKIQLLIATATLAWGINVPAHLVIVKGTEYYDGKTHKYVDFPVTDVLQMIGRAGRPQYDTSAVAVVFVQDVKKNFYKKFLYESFPVESSLLAVLPNHVNAEICAENITTKQMILDYLSGTYLYRRIFANPAYYRVEDFSDAGLTKFLTDVVDSCVANLIDARCITSDTETGILTATPLGRIGSKYYLEYLTIRHFAEKLTAGQSVEDLLRILADCPEYAEIPVRHNEDQINEEMSRLMPIKLPNGTDWESPHVKVHLLYQAHFSRIQIPVDYLTDQRSILESCIRILQAMFDCCVFFEWLDTAINVVILLQQIVQARWYYDHPLLCLPHLSAHSIDGLAPMCTVPELQDKFGLYGDIARLADAKQKLIVQKIMHKTILDECEAKEVANALVRWPMLRVADARLQQGLQECSINIRLFEARTDDDYAPLLTSSDYKLRLQLQLLGPNKHNSKAFAPKYPKEKVSGWIVLLGERATKKIYSCQKVNTLNADGSKFVRLSFTSPSVPGRFCLTVYVLSDSYLGIDQEYQVFCDAKTAFH